MERTTDAAKAASRSDDGSKALAELTAELDALIASFANLGPKQESYLANRWRPQVRFAKRRTESNRKWYYSWRVPTVVGALLLPALTSPTVEVQWARWTAFAVSLVVAVCTALESTFRFGNRWRLYRRMLDELRAEGWAFAYRIGPYAPPMRATFGRFVSRTEKSIRRYGEEYITDVLVLGSGNQAAPEDDDEALTEDDEQKEENEDQSKSPRAL